MKLTCSKRHGLASLVLVGPLLACAHEEAPKRKTRLFEPGAYGQPVEPSKGSLFGASEVGLVEDIKPRSVGDVIIVRVDESDSALSDASTKLDRSSGMSFGVGGLVDEALPDANLAQLFEAQSSASMQGGGRIARRGQLKAMLPVRVREVLPNGDLYVEGTKIVLVGNEERNLYLSGIVRPADIEGDGSVRSSRVADAEIAYTGQGDATDQQNRGWLSEILTTIWPF